MSRTVRFHTPTADTGAITSQLTHLLAASFSARHSYHRADVLLHDFVLEDGLQTDLLGTVDLAANERSRQKMQAVDAINRKHGKGTVQFAAETLSQAWQPKRRLMSPRYTSAWSELPEVKML